MQQSGHLCFNPQIAHRLTDMNVVLALGSSKRTKKNDAEYKSVLDVMVSLPCYRWESLCVHVPDTEDGGSVELCLLCQDWDRIV